MTLIDISISYTPEINNIKKCIGINNFINKEIFIKQQQKYLDDLFKYKKYENKKNKIIDRIQYINLDKNC